jgi:hypothetical protein
MTFLILVLWIFCDTLPQGRREMRAIGAVRKYMRNERHDYAPSCGDVGRHIIVPVAKRLPFALAVVTLSRLFSSSSSKSISCGRYVASGLGYTLCIMHAGL